MGEGWIGGWKKWEEEEEEVGLITWDRRRRRWGLGLMELVAS